MALTESGATSWLRPNRRWNFPIANMSAEPPDDRAAPEGSGARPSSSFPFRKIARASA